MHYLKYLLFPFAALYGLMMQLRNLCYDKGWFRSYRFEVPVICVGNLTVGGTGKTPHVEYLVRQLQKERRIAILSRGYKRRTKGFVLAGAAATPATLGDEPYQYHRDFPGVAVAVCENRAVGIEKLLQLNPPPDLILLDDAYQHRRVQPCLNLLLTDYYRLFYQDYILPLGRLREPRSGASRAHAVIVSKCPEQLTEAERQNIRSHISRYTASADVPVYFSAYRYGKPVPLGPVQKVARNVLVLTGIAQPAPLLHYLQESGFTVAAHEACPDHYAYTRADVEALQRKLLQLGPDTCILTTRKDAVKLQDPQFRDLLEQMPVFYIPIEVKLLEDEQAVLQELYACVNGQGVF